jgi:hypothetical protein
MLRCEVLASLGRYYSIIGEPNLAVRFASKGVELHER